ncbi:MAG TPA: trypsin-like peptidase domain-containing protein [Polyangiaceae bacterium]|nr:trypsin-like peptidase domain-containing protein [Polyangiaceae bacterium]
MILLDQPSCQSLYVEARFEDVPLSTATGFVVTSSTGQNFLITNWHVVSGRHVETREPLHSSAGVPNRLVILHNLEGSVGDWTPKSEQLYDGGAPRWLEHPEHGSKVDVIALPLRDVDGIRMLPYSYAGAVGHDAATLPAPMKWGPSDFVNIVGFPFGLTGGGALAIWVQGAVATEPDIPFRGLPRFLIDSRTRPGQSGSPVVFYKRNGWITLMNGRPYMIHNPFSLLLGVYSGRISSESDLGFVWNVSALAAIVERGRPGCAS